MITSNTYAGCECLILSPCCLPSTMQRVAWPSSLTMCQEPDTTPRQAINAGYAYGGIQEQATAQSLNQVRWGGSRTSGFPRCRALPGIGSKPLKSQGASGLVRQPGQCPKQETPITEVLGEITGVPDSLGEETNPGDQALPADQSMPDITLFQDVCLGSVLPGIGKVYLHMVADSAGFVRGLLHTSDGPEGAVAALEKKVFLPAVSRVVTPRGPTFCGSIAHPYERYLARHFIEHIHLIANYSSPSRCLIRFQRAVLHRFFGSAFPQCRYESLEAVQKAFDSWLDAYNEVHEAQRLW